jgi:hypothetical protein
MKTYLSSEKACVRASIIYAQWAAAALAEINYPATLPFFTVHITIIVIGITRIFFHIMALNPS